MKREWWPGTGLNRRRRPFQGRALPLSYLAWSAEPSIATPCALSGDAGRKAGGSASSALQQGQVYQFELPRPNFPWRNVNAFAAYSGSMVPLPSSPPKLKGFSLRKSHLEIRPKLRPSTLEALSFAFHIRYPGV